MYCHDAVTRDLFVKRTSITWTDVSINMERLYTEQYTSYKPCLSYILTIVKWPVREAEIILLSPYKNSFVELFSDSNLQSLLKDTFINSEINYLCG